MELTDSRYSTFSATALLYLMILLAVEVLFRYSSAQFLQVINPQQLVVSFSGLFVAMTIPACGYAGVCVLVGRLGGVVPGRARPFLVKMSWLLLWLPFAFLMYRYFGKWVYATFKTGVLEDSSYAFTFATVFVAICLAIVHLRREEILSFVASSKRVIFLCWAVCTMPFALSFATEFWNANSTPALSVRDPASYIILVVSGEGLLAERMSVYGYELDTTPFLTKLAHESYVFDRAYSSATKSRPSMVSLLTGKSPLIHEVIDNNGALKGKNQFEHLPGILSSAGYYNADFTTSGGLGHIGWRMTHVTDPDQYNMRDGFDMIDGRERRTPESVQKIFASLSKTNISLFWASVIWKEFLGQSKPSTRVRRLDAPTRSGPRIEEFEPVLDLMRHKRRRLFIHIHDLVTHPVKGGKFRPEILRFSKDDPDPEAGYDDAILSFDYHVEFLVGRLRELGLWDATLLVVTSDHRRCFASDGGTIPLLVHLPGQTTGARSRVPVCTIDLPPTILQCLGLEIPRWVEGTSLLGFVDGAKKARGAPIFQLGNITPWDQTWCFGQVSQDDRWYATVITDHHILIRMANGAEEHRFKVERSGQLRRLAEGEETRPMKQLERTWKEHVDRLRSLLNI